MQTRIAAGRPTKGSSSSTRSSCGRSCSSSGQQRSLHAGTAAAPHRAATGCAGRSSRHQASAAALPGDLSGWGEQQMRPDACSNLGGADHQDRPGPLSSIDQEWQEFISGRGRYTQPQPLLWDRDSLSSPGTWPPPSGSSNNADGSGSNPSTSNRGPEASCSSSSSGSQRYSSSIQSFDDWDLEGTPHALPVPVNAQQQQQQQPPVNEALPLTGTSANSTSSSSSNPAAAAAAAGVHSLSAAGGQESLWGAMLQQPSRDLVAPVDGALGSRGLWQDMREVYVLLFGVGQKDTEGIYSLRAVSEDGLPTETIIAFENMDDAVRYAALLEATMEHSPHVCSIPPAELMAFCSDSGYRCRLELEGSLLMPPEYNVHITDWERSLRLREGKFHVLQEEPDLAASADALDSSAMAFMGMLPMNNNSSSSDHEHGMSMPSMAGYSFSRDSPFVGEQPPQQQQQGSSSGSEFSASELDSLKAQLEALLPATPADGDGAKGGADGAGADSS